MTVVKDVPKEERYKIVLAMHMPICHLEALKVARKPLSLPFPYWLSITKVCIAYLTLGKLLACYAHSLQVIDELHFKNHIDKACREKYDPSVIKDKHPGMGFMSAEQTFTWLFSAQCRKSTICSILTLALPKTEIYIWNYVIV